MRSTTADDGCDDSFDHDHSFDSATSQTLEPPPPMKALFLLTRPESTLAVSQAVELAEVPRPLVSNHKSHAIIQIQATAITLEDLYTSIGRRPLLNITPTPTKPVIPGIDFMGQVTSDSNDLKKGDVVMGCLPPVRVRHGSWAQYLQISSNNIIKVPNGWTQSQAAAFGMSALVAHAALAIVYPEPKHTPTTSSNTETATTTTTTLQQRQLLVGVVGRPVELLEVSSRCSWRTRVPMSLLSVQKKMPNFVQV